MNEKTGLQYMQARWMMPELGRFLSSDPARQGINHYIYCGNNPTTNIDPDGLETFPSFVGRMPDWYIPYFTQYSGLTHLANEAYRQNALKRQEKWNEQAMEEIQTPETTVFDFMDIDEYQFVYTATLDIPYVEPSSIGNEVKGSIDKRYVPILFEKQEYNTLFLNGDTQADYMEARIKQRVLWPLNELNNGLIMLNNMCVPIVQSPFDLANEVAKTVVDIKDNGLGNHMINELSWFVNLGKGIGELAGNEYDYLTSTPKKQILADTLDTISSDAYLETFGTGLLGMALAQLTAAGVQNITPTAANTPLYDTTLKLTSNGKVTNNKVLNNVDDFVNSQYKGLKQKLGKKIGQGRLPFKPGKEGFDNAVNVLKKTLNNPSKRTGIIPSKSVRGNYDLIHIYSKETNFTVSLRVLDSGVYEFDTLIQGVSSKF